MNAKSGEDFADFHLQGHDRGLVSQVLPRSPESHAKISMFTLVEWTLNLMKTLQKFTYKEIIEKLNKDGKGFKRRIYDVLQCLEGIGLLSSNGKRYVISTQRLCLLKKVRRRTLTWHSRSVYQCLRAAHPGAIDVIDLALSLNVPQRRMYDIFSILRAIGVVTKIHNRCFHKTASDIESDSYWKQVLDEIWSNIPADASLVEHTDGPMSALEHKKPVTTSTVMYIGRPMPARVYKKCTGINDGHNDSGIQSECAETKDLGAGSSKLDPMDNIEDYVDWSDADSMLQPSRHHGDECIADGDWLIGAVDYATPSEFQSEFAKTKDLGAGSAQLDLMDILKSNIYQSGADSMA